MYKDIFLYIGIAVFALAYVVLGYILRGCINKLK